MPRLEADIYLQSHIKGIYDQLSPEREGASLNPEKTIHQDQWTSNYNWSPKEGYKPLELHLTILLYQMEGSEGVLRLEMRDTPDRKIKPIDHCAVFLGPLEVEGQKDPPIFTPQVVTEILSEFRAFLEQEAATADSSHE